MKKSGIHLLKFLVVAGSIVAASSSQASLVPAGTVDLSGTGIGTVSTILTIHDNDGTEAGEVHWTAGGNVATGNVVGPNVQTKTQLFGDVGIDDAADIRIIFNASEPSGGSISLDDLVMNIFAPDGTLLFTSGVFVPLFFLDTEPGTGNTGFAFMLDAIQAAAAEPFVTAANRIGLSAEASMAQGGLETFFILRGEGVEPCNPAVEVCGPQEIPEPGTLALLGIGLIGASVLNRSRRKR